MPRTVAVPILAAALLISLPVACTGSTKPAILPKEGEFVCARISCQNTIINILRHQMVVGGRMRERQLRVVRGKDPTLLCTILCISDVVGTRALPDSYWSSLSKCIPGLPFRGDTYKARAY